MIAALTESIKQTTSQLIPVALSESAHTPTRLSVATTPHAQMHGKYATPTSDSTPLPWVSALELLALTTLHALLKAATQDSALLAQHLQRLTIWTAKWVEVALPHSDSRTATLLAPTTNVSRNNQDYLAELTIPATTTLRHALQVPVMSLYAPPEVTALQTTAVVESAILAQQTTWQILMIAATLPLSNQQLKPEQL